MPFDLTVGRVNDGAVDIANKAISRDIPEFRKSSEPIHPSLFIWNQRGMSNNGESDKTLTAAIVGELLAASKASPHMTKAGNNVAGSLAIISSTIKHVLLPLAALNYGIEKAQAYFNVDFESDLAKKASSIPTDCLVEPKPSIAGPALQGLAFVHDEPDLKEMYLRLLASAMDSRSAEGVHPAYSEIIRQLSGKEAPLLKSILIASATAIGEIQARRGEGTEFLVVNRSLLGLEKDGKPYLDERLPAMVNNWERLGLLKTSFDHPLADGTFYENLRQRPEYLDAIEAYGKDKVSLRPGALYRTDFGGGFGVAIGAFD